MNIKDIPQQVISDIDAQLDANPVIQRLRIKQSMMMSAGKYKEALDVARRIDEIHTEAVYQFLKESEKDVERIAVADTNIPLEDKEELMKLFLVCFMCADMIESSVIDMDNVLRKHDKNMRIDTFDDIKAVMKAAKNKLQFLKDNSAYMQDLVWADNCDNLYEMAKSKAGAIMRKRKDNPNWGENMKKRANQK